MKAKKVYQICLVLCGLFLALTGIACLVVATLLNHDSDLRMSHESMSRTYGTQYWLGLPIIAFGGLLMLISPSLQKREKMTAFGVLTCIPLLTCALVGSILHGTAYTHFYSMQQNRVFLQDHSYVCSDVTKDSPQCQCTKTDRLQGITNNILLAVPCAQQKSLVGFHGALLTFSALAFALLLGILVICVIFLLHFFRLQVPINTTTGQNNEGFSHARDRNHSIGVHIDPLLSQHPSQTTLNIPNDHPPSYESLMTSLDMTSHGMTSRDNMSRGTIVTYDVTDERNIEATVNRQARVRYRGQLSSALMNQIPERENSPNEVSSSNELENTETQVADNVVDGAAATLNSESIPQGETFRTSRDRQVSVERNGTTQSDNREVTPSTTRRDIETRRQQIISNNINDARPEQNSETSIETRSGRNARNAHLFFEPSGEMLPHGGRNSIGRSSSIRNANPSEQSNEMNRRVLRTSSLRTPHPSSIDHNMQVTYERGNPIGRNVTNPLSPSMEHTGEIISHERSITNPSADHSNEMLSHNSRLTPHAPLESAVSNNSEDGVYIDITESLAHSSGHSGDSTRIAVRYRGQVDTTAVNSIQTRSLITHEQDDIADENIVNINLQERTTDEVLDPTNAINSLQSSTEQTTDSLNNDTVEVPSIVTDNLTGDEIHSDIPPRRDSQSISSETNDIYPHNADTNSLSSLEVMSI